MDEFLEMMQALSSNIEKHSIKKTCICGAKSLVYYTNHHGREVLAIKCESCGIGMYGVGYGSTVEEFCTNALADIAGNGSV